MATSLGWFLFALGGAHLVFGAVRFRRPLAAAWSEGFVGRFAQDEARRTAFWFMLAGPQLMLAGQVAVHAAATGQPVLLRLVGGYLFGATAVGVAAFPRSPLPVAMLLGALLLGCGFGWW